MLIKTVMQKVQNAINKQGRISLNYIKTAFISVVIAKKRLIELLSLHKMLLDSNNVK